MQNFKSINLIRSDIPKHFHDWLSNYECTTFKDLSTNKELKYEFNITEKLPPALIRFMFNADGTTTIVYTIGKNQTLGYLAAKHMCGYADDRINVNEVIENVDNFFELIDDLPNTIRIEHGREPTQYSVNYILYSPDQDTLSLTYYVNKKKLLIQGKPLTCYRAFKIALGA